MCVMELQFECPNLQCVSCARVGALDDRRRVGVGAERGGSGMLCSVGGEWIAVSVMLCAGSVVPGVGSVGSCVVAGAAVHAEVVASEPRQSM